MYDLAKVTEDRWLARRARVRDGPAMAEAAEAASPKSIRGGMIMGGTGRGQDLSGLLLFVERALRTFSACAIRKTCSDQSPGTTSDHSGSSSRVADFSFTAVELSLSFLYTTPLSAYQNGIGSQAHLAQDRYDPRRRRRQGGPPCEWAVRLLPA